MRQKLPGSLIAHPEHGPLPMLLLLLTVVTGMVDAVSILALGRVFIANMTGNVVFLGFAISGTPGFAVTGLVTALGCFTLGAGLGGAIDYRLSSPRDVHLRYATLTQAALYGLALVVALNLGDPLGPAGAVVIVGIGAVAMGIQTAMVWRLAVPDLTTAVVTVTLVALASDIRRQPAAVAIRRGGALLAMLVGAAAGAVVVVHLGLPAALGVIIALLLAVSVSAALVGRTDQPWQERRWKQPKW